MDTLLAATLAHVDNACLIAPPSATLSADTG
jgi:hypothetical protein